MAIIPRFYKDAVVAIGIRNSRTKILWIATGFVVARANESGSYNTFLITNKHVFEKEDGTVPNRSLVFRFNLKDSINAKDYDVEIMSEDGKKFYSVHKNKKTDVAAMIINPNVLMHDLGDLSVFPLDNISLTRQEMIDNEVVEGALVYMLGFPSGIVGLNSKAPLCRLGCISRITEPSPDGDYLIDIQNFPGSSGSPIINRIELNHLTNTKSFNKTALVGIVSAYLPYQDTLISSQTGKPMEILNENSGLAIVFDVDSIKQTVEIESARNKKA